MSNEDQVEILDPFLYYWMKNPNFLFFKMEIML